MPFRVRGGGAEGRRTALDVIVAGVHPFCALPACLSFDLERCLYVAAGCMLCAASCFCPACNCLSCCAVWLIAEDFPRLSSANGGPGPRHRMPMSPKEDGAPWSGSNGGGEFGEELKRAHEHQNNKMAAEYGASAGHMTAASAANSSTTTADSVPSPKPISEPSTKPAGGGKEGLSRAVATEGAASKAPTAENPDSAMPERQPKHDAAAGDDVIPRKVEDGEESSATAVLAGAEVDGGSGDYGDGGEMGALEPGKVRVRALYDYDATQDGDLSFSAGDMIVADGSAFSGDGWVSGECHGRTGIFPANYTESW